MKWVKTLTLGTDNPLERRLLTIIEHILSSDNTAESVIHDIDATGKLGMEFTRKIDNRQLVKPTHSELLELLAQDGQIFDLDLIIKGKSTFMIIVGRGDWVDILGDTELPAQILGLYEGGDLANYNL